MASSAHVLLIESRNAPREMVSRNGSLKFTLLSKLWRRSLRNGSWIKLSSTRKALYRCALWIARVRGCISNTKLVEQVLQITWQLHHYCQSRIGIAGKMKALTALERFGEPGGVFSWAPRLRGWLHDPRYQAYLGLLEINR